MKTNTFYVAAIVSSLVATSAFAQDKSAETTENSATNTSITSTDGVKGKRAPIDFEKFSRMEQLKAADTDGDGSLSREEIEALALKRIVERAANRMERRLDINGDGKVTLEEIEKQRQKEFAALDRNEDGKLDRREMRAGGKFHHKAHDRHSKVKMENHHHRMQK